MPSGPRGEGSRVKVSQEEFPYQALLHFLEDGIFFVGIQNQGVQLTLPQADQEGHTLRCWERSQVASPGERWGNEGRKTGAALYLPKSLSQS